MTDLGSELAAANRIPLLRYIASAIHSFTIMARDPDMGIEQKGMINNLIHYLAGHLNDLLDPDEQFSPYRLDDIIAISERLNSGLASNIRAYLNSSA